MSLHKNIPELPQQLVSLYQTAVNHYDVMKKDVFLQEREHRNTDLPFARTNI